MENERLTRTYRINEEVFIFEGVADEVPTIIKGRVVGALSEDSIFAFNYQIRANCKFYYRHAHAIFKSLDEVRDFVNDMFIG